MTEAGRSGREDFDLPDDERQAWDAIVADLRGQLDLGPAFPAARSDPAGQLVADGEHPDPLADPVELVDDDEASGYDPPEPPPIPVPADAAARMSWAAVAIGPILAVVAGLRNWDDWIIVGAIAMTIGGFVALVARRAERDDDGDGAVI